MHAHTTTQLTRTAIDPDRTHEVGWLIRISIVRGRLCVVVAAGAVVEVVAAVALLASCSNEKKTGITRGSYIDVERMSLPGAI